MTDVSSDIRRRNEGMVFLVLFGLTIPAANWMIGHVGTTCVPQGPCLLPVAPGLMAPSGVAMIGIALVLRDLVQRRLGVEFGIGAIIAGAAISAGLAPPSLVIASAAAFLLSEFADFAVYTPLARRRLVLAVVASSLVGLVVDSIVFLYLAFGSLEFLLGQIVGKAWMVLLAIPLVSYLRRRDEGSRSPSQTYDDWIKLLGPRSDRHPVFVTTLSPHTFDLDHLRFDRLVLLPRKDSASKPGANLEQLGLLNPPPRK